MLLSWWVPVITGLAAFLGVVVGQLVQGRRDNKRWKQETERWQAEREDQREKDRVAWERENKYRFVEYKRELYTELLTHIDLYRRAVSLSLLRLSLIFSSEPAAVAERKRLSGDNVPNMFTAEDVRAMHIANGRIKLFAPKELADLADSYIVVITTAMDTVHTTDPEDEVELPPLEEPVGTSDVITLQEQLEAVRERLAIYDKRKAKSTKRIADAKHLMEPTGLEPLRRLMRADLGEIPTPNG